MKDSHPNAGLVLHILASGGLYGIERMLLSLLPALRARGQSVALTSFNEPGLPGAEIGDALSRRGVPVHYVRLTKRVDLPGMVRLHRAFRRTRPNIVHVHGYKATIFGGALARLHRIPTVATCHSEATRETALSTYVKMEQPILRRLPAVVAVSTAIKGELETRGVPRTTIRVIPNGIDDHFAGRSTRDDTAAKHPRLAVVGRLIEGKNIHLLIDAVAQLRSDFPDIVLHVAGEGPYREALERRVADHHLTDSVRFLGFVEDVYGLLAGCDCFVLPSQTEGMPISLLEAMSFGVPIIASAVGSIPSVARQDVDAILIPPNDPAALSGALRRVLQDDQVQARLGASARRRFLEEYTADAMADRYLQLYREVLGHRSNTHPRQPRS